MKYLWLVLEWLKWTLFLPFRLLDTLRTKHRVSEIRRIGKKFRVYMADRFPYGFDGQKPSKHKYIDMTSYYEQEEVFSDLPDARKCVSVKINVAENRFEDKRSVQLGQLLSTQYKSNDYSKTGGEIVYKYENGERKLGEINGQS